jgi:hypothetical protein
MILPWLLVILVLSVALIGLTVTLKRKAQAHREHREVPERRFTPRDRGADVHGRMNDQTGTYVGPS